MTSSSSEKAVNVRNWTELVQPEQLQKDPKGSDFYGKFTCEPLERGFGTTLGNSLRRILLSSLQGAGIVAIRIDGIEHEFSSIEGVQEDVIDIVLNLKQVRFLMDTEAPQHLELKADHEGKVLASDIQENQHVKVLNPEQHIATLTDDIELRIELEVRMGKSYVPAEQHTEFADKVGVIVLDASFSPIRKVAYRVEQARVGQITDYDKLILEVWTDGSITPEDSIAYSAKILKDQLTVFVNFDEEMTNKTEPEDQV